MSKVKPDKIESIIEDLPPVETEQDEEGLKEYLKIIKYLKLNEGELVYYKGQVKHYKVTKGTFNYTLGESSYNDRDIKTLFAGNSEKADMLKRYLLKNYNMHTKPTLNKFCYLTNATSQEPQGFRWRADLAEHKENIDNLSKEASTVKIAFDKTKFAYNCYIPIIAVKKANNKIIKEYIELTFKDDTEALLDWLSLYAFENRYQISRPTLMLKSNKRGTGKNTFLESVAGQIYEGSSCEITFDDNFNEWGGYKLVYIDEGGDTKYNPAALWDKSKQISGQGILKVNTKFGSKEDQANGSYCVIMSNDPKPIHIKDEILSEDKNQILVIDMEKDSETDMAVEKLELQMHRLGYYHFKDFFADHLGHWVFTDLLEHYKKLKKKTKSKPYRYGMPVPITKGLKKLLQMSLSPNDIMILKSIEDLYYQNPSPYNLTEDEKVVFNMFASGTPKPESLKGYIPFSILAKMANTNKFEISAFNRFLDKRGWLYEAHIRISPIKGYNQKTFYGILVNINKITKYFEKQYADSQEDIAKIRLDSEYKGSFSAASDEAVAFEEPTNPKDSFDYKEEMSKLDELL